MSWKEWTKGEPILMSRIVWDAEEEQRIQDVLDGDWFGPGKQAEQFASEIARLHGVRFCLPVNSGSSALKLITDALLHLNRILPETYVLHPALTFPTSIAPSIQAGLIPMWLDVDRGTYVVNARQVAQAVEDHGSRIGCAVIPHLLGNIPNMRVIMDALGDIPLIEDCCDTLGGRYAGKSLGSFGVAAATSFYGSHHISTLGVGGALLTSDEELFEVARSMCFWGRSFTTNGDKYDDFVARYTYRTIGYDMQMTEMQAAFGLGQLTRLPELLTRRGQAFEDFYRFLISYRDWLQLPVQHPKAQPSWFGFPLTVRGEAPFNRKQLALALMDAGVEIRPLFTGDITRQAAFRGIGLKHAATPNAEDCGDNALFFPAWGHMTLAQIAHVKRAFQEFFKQVGGRYATR